MVITLKSKRKKENKQINKNILYIIFVSLTKTRDKITTFSIQLAKNPLESVETYKTTTSRAIFKAGNFVTV